MTNGKLIVCVASVLLVSACGGPPTPGPESQQAAPETETVQLGGPATGAGTLNADSGEYQPADPAKFHKEPGYSPYAGRRYPGAPVLR